MFLSNCLFLSGSFSLNTHVESPHHKKITSIEFSSKYDMDNLICATASIDKTVKIWSLESTENVHSKLI